MRGPDPGGRLLPPPTAAPRVAGVLTAAQVAATATAVAAVQEPDGAVPLTRGDRADVWNHVEAAMALLVGGRPDDAERAYAWCLATQRADGSWPRTFRDGRAEDENGETNPAAYLAVGVWHHWLVRRDPGFVRRHWPAVRRGLDWVVSLQLPFGGIAWAQEWVDGRAGRPLPEALLAASSSIHHALRAGVALAELVDEPQPEWELAGGRLAHALRAHQDEFADRSTFSMDWYYPVLGGAVRGPAARRRIGARWADFVVPGLGIRCVDTNPWVTGAETCELAMALDALGDRRRALRLLADMQHLRAADDGYWTGYVYPDRVTWPVERTTYTAAAVVLAADALGRVTGGSGILRGESLGPPFPELALECGCPSADRVAGAAAYPA